ncbi:hypothetical protein MKY84_04070 [Chryseomicrobium sp. FSL W7-1435]|uniref:hypothetical protein n=1 Tax=Chryseomicrobium sp. FSL W7-1435 TaxID=2921704 RepID=UPI00315AB895
MKKFWIVLVILVGLRWLSIGVYEAKAVDEPVVVASQMNMELNSVFVSYITNTLEPADVERVEIEGHNFAPGNGEIFFFEEMPQVNAQLEVEYPYHAIYSATIQLPHDGYYEFIENAETLTIHFRDGSSQVFPLQVLQKLPTNDVLISQSWIGSNETQTESYRAQDDFLLTDIIPDERIEILSIHVNNKELNVPLTEPISISRGDSFVVVKSDSPALFLGEWGTVKLEIKEEFREPSELFLVSTFNSRPSEEWIQAQVQEAKKK